MVIKIWWRWRESNPRPEVAFHLEAYSLVCHITKLLLTDKMPLGLSSEVSQSSPRLDEW